MEGIREKFFKELLKNIRKAGMKEEFIKEGYPKNGETLKIKGKVLYKIIRLPNPFGSQGIVVHKDITQQAIDEINGSRSKNSKDWVGCRLTEKNYETVMKMLLSIVEKINLLNKIKEGKNKWEN